MSNEYRQLKRRNREVLGLDDFTEADLAAIRTAEPPPETVQYDHELKEAFAFPQPQITR